MNSQPQGITSIAACWQLFLTRLEKELGKDTVDKWARSLIIKSTNGAKLTLEAKDSFQALWFEEHLKPRLSGLVDPLGASIQVSLQIAGRTFSRKAPKKAMRSSKQEENKSLLAFPEIDLHCTFEKFISLSDNEIVIRLFDEVCSYLAAEKLKQLSSLVVPNRDSQRIPPPNPVYLFGPSGSGKTHLLSAATHRLRQAGLSVIMAKSDLFTEHVVKSIRAGEMFQFRKLWRNVDALVVDDIHCLARKNATQEEFFHTFNTLHVAGKQIILAANCLPQQLQFIEPRLISRFEWGVVLPLRVLPHKRFSELLEKRVHYLNVQIPQKCIRFLVDTFSSSPKICVKALDLLIHRLTLSQNYPHAPFANSTLSYVADILADLIEEEQCLALTPEKIINVTAEIYGVKKDDLTGRSQSRECVLPRQIAMFLIRKHLKTPFMKIGDIFQKNHSTVMSSISQVGKLIPDPSSDVGSAIASIEMRLTDIAK